MKFSKRHKNKCISCITAAVFLFLAVKIILPVNMPVVAANYTSNPNIRVALIYGSGAVDNFETYATAESGFILGYVKSNTGETFNSLITLNKNKIAVTKDENLSKNSADKYYVNNQNIVIGKYNAEFDRSFANFGDAASFINGLPTGTFEGAFPAYIDGKIVVRTNSFSSLEAANSFISKVSGYSMKAVGGSANGMTVIDPDTDTVLFEFENDGIDMAAAVTSGYIRSPAGNIYTGAMIYRVKSLAVEVINLVCLEDYVKGIVSTEISPEWHDEVLKAFSIASRTYTLHAGSRHASDGYTLCNSVHCQWYLGLKYATEKSKAAVDSTKDMVITYNGKTIEAVYYSSAGGVTETHNDAWGGPLSHPYLVSVPLPLEKYTDENYKNALWKNTVSPKELADYLLNTSSSSSKFKGVISGSIAKIKINERSNPSNYVKDVDIIDKNGNTVNIKYSDNVRIAFSRYVNSANMDIYTSFSYPIINKSEAVTETKDLYIISKDGTAKTTIEADEINILTSSGTKTFSTDEYDFVFDGKGWGHGVGMSQYAAKDLAEAGYSYSDILKTFYTGVSISKITDISK